MREKLKLQGDTVEKSLLDAISAKLAETVAQSAIKAQEDTERIEALTKNTVEVTKEIEKLKALSSDLEDKLAKSTEELQKAKEDILV